MSFFDFPAPPPKTRQITDNEVWRPHGHVIPGTVGADVLLARTDDIAVSIGAISARRNGFAFPLTVASRQRPLPEDLPIDVSEEGAPALRIGIGFSDGRRVKLENWWWGDDPAGDAEREIRLLAMGSSGSSHVCRLDYWLWPLPPAGPLRFAISWLDEGIEERIVELDSALVRDAAARAVELWPPEPPTVRVGQTAYEPL